MDVDDLLTSIQPNRRRDKLATAPRLEPEIAEEAETDKDPAEPEEEAEENELEAGDRRPGDWPIAPALAFAINVGLPLAIAATAWFWWLGRRYC